MTLSTTIYLSAIFLVVGIAGIFIWWRMKAGMKKGIGDTPEPVRVKKPFILVICIAILAAGFSLFGLVQGHVISIGKAKISNIDTGEYPLYWHSLETEYLETLIGEPTDVEGEWKKRFRKFDSDAVESVDDNPNYLVVKYKTEVGTGGEHYIKKIYLKHIPIPKK